VPRLPKGTTLHKHLDGATAKGAPRALLFNRHARACCALPTQQNSWLTPRFFSAIGCQGLARPDSQTGTLFTAASRPSSQDQHSRNGVFSCFACYGRRMAAIRPFQRMAQVQISAEPHGSSSPGQVLLGVEETEALGGLRIVDGAWRLFTHIPAKASPKTELSRLVLLKLMNGYRPGQRKPISQLPLVRELFGRVCWKGIQS